MADRGRGRGQDNRGRGSHSSQPPGGRGQGGGYQGGRGGFERGGMRGGYGPRDDGGRGGGRGDRGGRGGGRGGRGGPVLIFNAHEVAAPNEAITRLEDETIAVARTQPGSSQHQKKPIDAVAYAAMPQRPDYGTKGAAIVLRTNHFEMVAHGAKDLKRYNIEVTEVGEQSRPVGKKLKRIIQLFLEEHLARYKGHLVTDFKAILVSTQDLDPQVLQATVRHRAEGEDEPSPNSKSFNIKVQATGTLTVAELVDYLTSTQASALLSSKNEIIQALNLVVGYHPKCSIGVTTAGANKHFSYAREAESHDLMGGLVVLRGFFVSVRAATARLLVNVQVKNGAFYKQGTLDGLMEAFLGANNNKHMLERFLKRVCVDATHILKNNKTGDRVPRVKVIWGLASPDDGHDEEYPPKVSARGAGPKGVEFFLRDAPNKGDAVTGSSGKKTAKTDQVTKAMGKLSTSGGKYISVYDFFKQTYNFTIRNTNLPVVNVGSRARPSYLPPQVCQVLPGQLYNAKLSPNQTQEMIKFAVRTPSANANSIVGLGARLLGFEPSDRSRSLDDFGLNITPRMISVPGRVLARPDVQYQQQNKRVNVNKGSWNMLGNRFVTGARLDRWAYLWITQKGKWDPWNHKFESMEEDLSRFTKTLQDCGIAATKCIGGQIVDVDDDNAEAAIDKAFAAFARSATRAPPQLVLVILPSPDATIYNRVKYAGDVREGILNVCVQASKFKGARESYQANVALKVNLKLGGRNHLLESTKLGILAQKETMVVGIDVTHPSPGSSPNAPSVAGVVASIDHSLSQWPAELRAQTGRQEMVADLNAMVQSRLRLWQKKNEGKLPQNLLVYRDGVSEGQYNLVLENELPLLREACKAVYPATSTKTGLPRISIIVVGKRHNTRFYPTKADDADDFSNPKNGTVVDRGVTEARNWDFFLQAHTALTGTARPAHYYIVYDEIFRAKASGSGGNTSDNLQELTHNMCYLYGRATKAVSICPPAYYADLVCERARCYLSHLFDPTASSNASTQGAAPSAGQSSNQTAVLIHPRVCDSMFYI